ncbi:MAG: O-antigen ligase family protein [Methylococcaceae bacterium]|nr:O-antigen ligase family protein [Methylococcaceae bacterium]
MSLIARGTESSDRLIYFGLLLLLAWSPLPLGSDRPWSWSILAAGIFFLGSAWLGLYALGKAKISASFKAAQYCWLLMAMGIGWNAVQIIPLPLQRIAALSSHAAETYSSLAEEMGGTAYLSVDLAASRIALLKGMAYWVFFGLVLLLVNSVARLKTLAYVVVVSGIFQAFYGSVMTLSGLEYGFFHKKQAYLGVATGTFVNRNHLAGYLEMCLALGIGLLLSDPGGAGSSQWRAQLKYWLQLLLGPKALLRLGLVIMVIALVLTHSRMGNSAFFTSLLTSGTLGLILFKNAKKSTVILLASLVVIDVLIVGTWFGVEKVAQRIEQTSLVGEDRDDVDVYATHLLWDYWLTGSGAGSFYNAFIAYKSPGLSGFYDHAHNDYLQFACEFGLMGFLPLALAVSCCLWAGVKAQRKRRASLQRGMAFASSMGLIALLMHSSVDFNLQIPANALLFVSLMALSWIALCLEEKPLTHHDS